MGGKSMRTNKYIRIFTAELLILTLSGMLTGCGNTSEAQTSEAKTSQISEEQNSKAQDSGELPEKITMGYWESPNGELLAKETGALEKAYPAVDIEWVEFQSGTDILTAMQSGSLDFATIGTPPVVMGIANNYPFKIFYMHDVIGESEALVVKNSSGIKSLEDLKGKTIATTFGTTSHFAFLNLLKSAGVETSDFTLLDMQGPDIYAAWQRGDIDGAYTWEPVRSEMVEDDGIEIVSSADAAEVGGLTAEVGIVSDEFYAKYPDVVKNYIDILDASVQAYRKDPDQAAELMAGGLGLSVDATKTAMNEIIVKDKSEQSEYLGEQGVLAGTLKDTGDFLFDQKSITNAPDEATFAKAILSELYK